MANEIIGAYKQYDKTKAVQPKAINALKQYFIDQQKEKKVIAIEDILNLSFFLQQEEKVFNATKEYYKKIINNFKKK